MIHVFAQVEIVPGHRDAFLAEFAKVAPLVRAEVGCIEYGAAVDLTTDIAAQRLLGGEAVLIVEKWESLDHLKAHLAAPHMTPYRAAVKPHVVGTKLTILEPKV